MIQKGFIPLIIVIVIAVIGIIGAYYLGTINRNVLPSSTVTPTPAISSLVKQTSIPEATTTNIPATNKPSVSLYQTKGWVLVNNKFISFNYPSDKFKVLINTDKAIQLKLYATADNNMYGSPDFLTENYDGGSRRDWYINRYGYYTSEIGKNIFIVEKTLGKINALEVRPKESNIPTDILVSSENTIVDIRVQGTDLKLVETMVSTISFK